MDDAMIDHNGNFLTVDMRDSELLGPAIGAMTERRLRRFIAEEVKKALADFKIELEEERRKHEDIGALHDLPLSSLTSSQIWFGAEHFSPEIRSDTPHD